MNDLLIRRLGVVKVAQAKKLRDALEKLAAELPTTKTALLCSLLLERCAALGKDAQTNLATALRRRPRYHLRNVLQTRSPGTQKTAHIRGAGREKSRSPRIARTTNCGRGETRSAGQSAKNRSVQTGFSLSRHGKPRCPGVWKKGIL